MYEIKTFNNYNFAINFSLPTHLESKNNHTLLVNGITSFINCNFSLTDFKPTKINKLLSRKMEIAWQITNNIFVRKKMMWDY